ncbi:MAG: tRNA 2-thiouridine(34) synthase MnmA [Bacteriovoracaceae bacterium]|jgi:tRNA-specific 2-thiouridylase|nr:tRNA 2-thiouridine(34) synthase MnmA [Bacteriovoracaceae bacterium]
MNFTESASYLSKFGIKLTREEFDFNSTKTVILGMSGGVDSSACAAVLKLQGFNVKGMFMKNWEEQDEDGRCTSEKEYADVISVCEKLDIPYYSVNFVEEYRDNVFKYFVDEYEKGFTPNPDILCNREIKFKVFFNKAMMLGADYLATGHYCQKDKDNNLVKGADDNKDQTYFLYTIKNEILEKVLFPIGGVEKKYVRQIAKDFDLITHDKKDSTGICFIGERNFKNFLSNYIKTQKGNFIHADTGKVLGSHDGACFYTIGQRKGLGLGGPGGPWFVSSKNVESNDVYVVEGENNPLLFHKGLEADEISWVADEPTFPLKCKAKIRYRQKDQACTIKKIDNKLVVDFDEPQRAIAIRQSVVFYADDICLGGAIISDRIR